MTTQVIINGREVSNPATKFVLVISAILVATLIAATLLFVLLPLAGVAVTLSVGFMAVLLVAILAGIAILALSTVIFGWLFGPTEFRIEKQRKRK